MKINPLYLAFLLIILSAKHLQSQVSATKPDTSRLRELRIPSASMRKEMNARVLLPDAYFKDPGSRFPVVYLLHGYSGNYANWTEHVPEIRKWGNLLGCIIATPEGGYASWYFDSPVDSAFRYETHVAKEVVSYVDREFRTIASRKGRAISGLSMGGHGAMYLALRHPEVFGAAGSMSGGVDLRPFPGSWEIAKRIGSRQEFPERWEAASVVNNLHLWNEKMPVQFIIDCGTDDFFFDVNRALHEKMLAWRIPHDFIVRPGEHNLAYWKNAVLYQLLYFEQFFAKG
ncbi:MAG: esterase family protein [Saprospiraceae bacterium]|nr:esterase family protein [Saprospiraceae bacterium]